MPRPIDRSNPANTLALPHFALSRSLAGCTISRMPRDLLTSQPPSIATSVEPSGRVDRTSSVAEKIALFRCLFRGREEVHARRFASAKTGRAGYQPVCGNEWTRCQEVRA